MDHTAADIRQYLAGAYSDEELTTLCSDYFRDVYDNFAAGMTKTVKIQLLLDHCRRRELMPNLLTALERDRPDQYRKRFGQAADAPIPAEPSPKRDPRQVFISHAHEDAEFVHRLAVDLAAHGWRVWIAPDSILPGEKWVDAIERGLATSGVFVVALTPAAIRSRWVTTETNAAIALEHREAVRLAPLDVEACDVPLLWSSYQCVSFRGAYEDGLRGLLSWLDPPKMSVPPQPAVPVQKPTTADQHGAEALQHALRINPGFLKMAEEAATQPMVQPSRSAVPVQKPAMADQHGAEALQHALRINPGFLKMAEEVATQPMLQPLPGILTIESPIHLELVRVPADEFLMGSDPKVDKDSFSEEQPQHRLYLPEFYIGKYPVTNAQYAVFIRATKHKTPDHWEKGTIPAGKEEHPVISVSPWDAVAFCRWLSGATGRTFSLPTEAEWEKSARGVNGWIYPWGSDQPNDRRCNFGGRVGDTTPVDRYPAGASPCGALDMAGNVWERTSSFGWNYPYVLDDGREDTTSEAARVLRGGAFNYDARFVRCAYRRKGRPSSHLVPVGFRVVASSRSS